MRNIWALFLKDLKVFIRDRAAVALTFAVPAVLILIFGLIFGGSDGSSGIGGLRLIVIDEAQTAASAKLVQALKDEPSFRVATENAATDAEPARPLTREDARRMLTENAGTWRHAVILPTDLLAEDFGFHIELMQNPQSSVETQVIEGLLQKILFSKGLPLMFDSLSARAEETMGSGVMDRFNDELAVSIAKNFGADETEVRRSLEDGTFGFGTASGTGEGEGTDGAAMEGGLGQLMKIDREEVFGKGKNPAVQSVGGWAVMFLLFSLSAAAASLMVEKHEGLFLRLLSGPVTRLQVLWSKYLFTAFLGFVQLAVLMFYGDLFFNIITSASQLLPLLMVSIAGALAASSFGMLLAAVSKTEAQANGLATLIILSMSALGGAMFPIFMLPAFIQDTIAPLTLVYWMMDGIYGALWRDGGPVDVLPQVGVLLAIAGIVMPFSIWRFRTGDLFR